MALNSIILPGWGMPKESYLGISFSNSVLWDYGFWSEESSDDFDSFFDSLKNSLDGDSVVIAHSMGSVLALKAALLFEGIKALVLVSPFARFTEDEGYVGIPFANVSGMNKMLSSKPEFVLRRFYRDVFSPQKSTLKVPDTMNVDLLSDGLAVLESWDLRDSLAELNIPVLILQGCDDKVVDSDTAKWLSDNIAGSDYVEFSGVGHALPIVEAARCSELIASFAEKHSLSI